MFNDYTPEERGKLENRFWKKVIKSPDGGCWTWHGTGDRDGYGHIGVGGKTRLAHRVSWQLHYGNIPDGLFVLHHCDNPSCINPTHLFLGTAKDNMRDMVNKDRSAKKSRAYKSRNTKLSQSDVQDIRLLYDTGDFSQAEIAESYGISQRYVSYIINHERR